MKHKYAFITGVSRRQGLGFAVARQLAELDYHVILTARDIRKAEELAVELRRASHSATALRIDLVDRTSIIEAAGQLTNTFDHLDVLVNNASSFPTSHSFSIGRRSGCAARGIRGGCVWVLGADSGFAAVAAASPCGSHR